MPGRRDNVTDLELASALLLMRRGQAHWARKLNELSDASFDSPSLVPGWTRRHLIAHFGSNARAVARLVEWARTGVETPMYASPTQRAQEIEFGATLPIEALRNLCAHAAVHLNVEWRDLPEAAWTNEVRTAQGRLVPASETVWMRTREVWIHSVDLDNGGSFDDFPPVLVDLLLEDLIKVWKRKRTDKDPDLRLEPSDRELSYSILGSGEGPIVRGTAADLVRWGTGRGFRGVANANGTKVPKAPEWL